MSGETTPAVRKSARQPHPKIRFDDMDITEEIQRRREAAIKKAAKKAVFQDQATASSSTISEHPKTADKTVKEEVPDELVDQNAPDKIVKQEPLTDEPTEEEVDKHDITIKEVIENMMREQRQEAANNIALAKQAHDLRRAHQILLSNQQIRREQEKLERAAAIRESNRRYQTDTALIRRVDPKIAIHTGLRHTFAGTPKYATDFNVQPGVSQPAVVTPVGMVQNAITRKTEVPAIGRRNPINHRMVKPDDIVTSYQNHHVVEPDEVHEGLTHEEKVKNKTLSRNTFEKIGKNDSLVYQHVVPSRIHPNGGPANLATRPVPGPNREVGLPEIPMASADVNNVADRDSKKKKQNLPASRSVLFNIDEILPPDADNYEGVPGAEWVPSYDEDRLTVANPTLVKRLSRMFGYPYPLKPHYEERMGIEELAARKAEYERQKALSRGEVNFSNYRFKPTAPMGPPERKLYSTSTLSVSRLPESLNDSPVQVVYNGNQSEIPGEIYCDLCRSVMRLCMRRSRYRGEIKEYPAYRCLRKGCQTFRSVRKLIKPENESPMQAPETPSVSYRSLLDTDTILGSLMLMPENKARQLERVPIKEEETDENGQSNKPEVKEELMEADEDESWRGPNRLDELLNSHMNYDEGEGQEEPLVKPEPEDDFEVPNSNTVCE